ncbi:hypothetical protein BQ8482_111506 [Mesorhizobium delmotii]|uniref:Uncharacterized protein n=1 Tax=Mesorhizobium delmotii TaxID=1631247 RepID=A0A2P9AEN7_9HYPH|nr:hypothetical protein BQ8482_111506 [Mesorhizobium delmotii]
MRHSPRAAESISLTMAVQNQVLASKDLLFEAAGAPSSPPRTPRRRDRDDNGVGADTSLGFLRAVEGCRPGAGDRRLRIQSH